MHLRGELGSGKTTCARSLLHALGVTAHGAQPHLHPGRYLQCADLTCVHVDLYRVQSTLEVEELGLRDYDGTWVSHVDRVAREGRRRGSAGGPGFAAPYAGEARRAFVGAATERGAEWIAKLAIDTSLSPMYLI